MAKPSVVPTLQKFLSHFSFDPSRAGFLGVEREFFLESVGRCRCSFPGSRANLVPRAPDFLAAVRDDHWTYELSACQVEHRTDPCVDLCVLHDDLENGLARGQEVAYRLGMEIAPREVAPLDMPLENYPEPRYDHLRAHVLSPERYLAACRVTGTHVHYGVGSVEEALAVYNRLVRALPVFLDAGDGSDGERLRLYRIAAPACDPPPLATVEEFYAHAVEAGFADNPRNCWDLVRISRHGTVEVRAFGAPRDTETVLSWARLVRGFAVGRYS